MVWTSLRFARNDDGKAVGFECVTTVLEEVSVISRQDLLFVACKFGWPTFAGRAADRAGQDNIPLPGAAVEQVAAVGAEDEGADC
jgi:hypothetical protein